MLGQVLLSIHLTTETKLFAVELRRRNVKGNASKINNKVEQERDKDKRLFK